ncbi:hypothetical protein [Urbifossiella limnaea]|uniref:Uncharacterized protein n=1 Tax=Urbifossiella limnaea TaxID=2528023 RepID=A0A517XYV0_9BACT|nr:hypothetical protein [Urbifossiella limnaea]QDU22638.1 hypothetical protein ETAA1_46210 [Urbifossiella limnaea]
MEAERQRAYLMILSAALQHVKWDLACWYGRFAWLRPWRSRHQVRGARRAAFRSAAFHNLATFALHDFTGFSEAQFWEDIERFETNFPDGRWMDYRAEFERCLRGEAVRTIN